MRQERGETWKVHHVGNPRGTYVRAVDFVDEKVGWVAGDHGFAARTADGGKTWTRVKTGTTNRLNAVDVVDADTVFLVGNEGTAIGTNNGGKTMVPFDTGTDRDLRDCSFLDERTGFAVGRGGAVLRFVRQY